MSAVMTVADEIIRREAELSPWQEQDELESLYRELGDDEAGRVAVWAAERYEQRDSERERMLEVLIRLACFVPDALIGLHGRLIEAGLMSDFINRYGGQFAVLFASADSETRD